MVGWLVGWFSQRHPARRSRLHPILWRLQFNTSLSVSRGSLAAQIKALIGGVLGIDRMAMELPRTAESGTAVQPEPSPQSGEV